MILSNKVSTMDVGNIEEKYSYQQYSKYKQVEYSN